MRNVFKEIFSRYIEEREEINNGDGADGEEDGSKAPKNKSTSYPIKKKKLPEQQQQQGGEGKTTGNGGIKSTNLPSSSHPEIFSHSHHPNHLNPRNPGLVGHHVRGHHGGKGAHGKARSVKKATKRRKR